MKKLRARFTIQVWIVGRSVLLHSFDIDFHLLPISKKNSDWKLIQDKGRVDDKNGIELLKKLWIKGIDVLGEYVG